MGPDEGGGFFDRLHALVQHRCVELPDVAHAVKEQGQSVTALSPAIARPAHEAGAVRRVLDGWSLPMSVHAVMTSRLMPARVGLFIDFLAGRLTI
jgi:hypothetical protein